MPTLTINGKEITVDPGTTVLRAAAMLGIDIPHFCYHPALSVPANCRMCLVEIEKARKLEPSCYAKVGEGMVVHTESPKVIAARRAVLEFILVNHPVDCPICDQAGECKLQDYYVAYDSQPSRVAVPKVGKAKAYPIGPRVVFDGERCILCTRCVRFCDEITGTSELTVAERGDHSEIRTFPGKELDNPYSMNVTDICPVGALTTRDFRFKCRVWLMSSTDSICTGCAKGCNVHLEHFQGEAQRYRPRFNPEVNEYWMCDAGRMSYLELHADRLPSLRVLEDSELSWPRAARKVAALLGEKATGEGVAFVASAQSSCEGLMAGREFVRTMLDDAPVFWTGRPDGDGDAFLIRADKNPNRAGLAGIFGVEVLAQDAHRLLQELERGAIRVLYMMDSTLPFTSDEMKRFRAAVEKLELFVLQAPRRGGLDDLADVLLPSTTHAEQDGSFVNEDGLLQSFWAAYRPRTQALADWEVFVRLARGADRELSFSDFESLHGALHAEQGAAQDAGE
ncbi:MAG: ferredoxin [Deltaproteobacteria bacterium]|nr:MAG: ferredoxin [Deltaproteobacteria bacterium]